MSCRDLLVPYVRWAAQDQITDPYRYILGFAFTSTYANGDVVVTEGKMDVRSARFTPRSETFSIVLRGSGQRSRLQTPVAMADLATSRIAIQINADESAIRVRIGDVGANELVEDFNVQCQDSFFVSSDANVIHTLSMQMLEQQGEGWIAVDASPGDITDTLEIAAQSDDETSDAQATAEPAEQQDLQRIEGIGPQIASALESMGIISYKQLAAYTPEELESDLRDSGVDIKEGAARTWPAQATLAADEKWNALKYIQEEVLKGGRVALPDNLQRIKGIGARTAAALLTLNITSYKQIAQADPDQLEMELRSSGLNIATGAAASWPQQAELAAQYKWVELEALQQQWANVEAALQDGES